MDGRWRIAIDTGGTFTDCIGRDGNGRVYRQKVLSSSQLRGRVVQRTTYTSLVVEGLPDARPNLFALKIDTPDPLHGKVMEIEARQDADGNLISELDTGQLKRMLHQLGDDLIREYQFLEPLQISLLTQHRNTAPYGLKGGLPGKTGRQMRIQYDGFEELLDSSVSFEATPRERLRVETPGGGGWGTPT